MPFCPGFFLGPQVLGLHLKQWLPPHFSDWQTEAPAIKKPEISGDSDPQPGLTTQHGDPTRVLTVHRPPPPQPSSSEGPLFQSHFWLIHSAFCPFCHGHWELTASTSSDTCGRWSDLGTHLGCTIPDPDPDPDPDSGSGSSHSLGSFIGWVCAPPTPAKASLGLRW